MGNVDPDINPAVAKKLFGERSNTVIPLNPFQLFPKNQ